MANRRIYHLLGELFELLQVWLTQFRQQQEVRYRKLDAYLARHKQDG